CGSQVLNLTQLGLIFGPQRIDFGIELFDDDLVTLFDGLQLRLQLGDLRGCGVSSQLNPTREVATFVATFLETRVRLSTEVATKVATFAEVATKVATFEEKRIDCDTQDGIQGLSRRAYK
ncbi:hypothetical protein THAOC_23229, partial [Thalassiosira oceanica]